MRESMKGNRFWECRSSHGRRPIFESVDQLWNACVEYFEWVEDNPLSEAKAFSYEGKVTIEELPKMRAMTIGGLCLFIGISRDTWENYRTRAELKETALRVDEVIREQKFTGAAAGLLDSAIIARDLGLTDKKELGGQVQVVQKIERKIVRTGD